jgi:hypothetical protein
VLGPVTVVLVLVAVMVIVKMASGAGADKSGVATGQASAALVTQLGSVSAATFDAVGTGTAAKSDAGLPRQVNGAPLTRDGLPRVLYVGADYCPYCAGERWALVVALSRFGTFDALGTTASAPSDVFPNTPTLSFHDASYSSSVLAFDGRELYGNQARGDHYEPLDKLSDSDMALFRSTGGNSFPYVNIGGRYVIAGSSVSPKLLAGMTRMQIAAALKDDPHSPVAQAVDGGANVITAALCDVTGQRPANVCEATGVRAGAAKLSG